MDEFMVSGETHRPRPPARPPARRPSSVARCRSATCPTCSATSRRCRRSSGSPASSTRSSGGASRRGSRRPRSGGRRPTDRPCAPSTCYGSYSNGRDLPDDAKQLVARARELRAGARTGPTSGRGDAADERHRPPDAATVARTVWSREANEIQDDYRFVVTSLPEYVVEQPTDGLSTVRGELRSGARANVLMGVASNRVDVHQACAVAERALERRAEPLSALSCRPTGTRTRCSRSRGRSSWRTAPTTPRARAATTRSSTR